MRPNSDERFGELDPGLPITVVARSKDGWLGFDPGVAQAANVGPFRLRWVRPSDVVTRGNCRDVATVWTPEPHTCFEMAMEPVVVREAPRPDAKSIAVLHPGEFASIVGVQGGPWAKVDLSHGNTGSSAVGFIPANALNVNGNCNAPRKQ
jgi:hypothetical protein